MADILQGGKRDLSPQTTGFTVTAFSEDYTIASNEAGAANIAAVLTTLIRDLIRAGIVNGTVA